MLGRGTRGKGPLRSAPPSLRGALSCPRRVHSGLNRPLASPNGCQAINSPERGVYINAVFMGFVGEMSILY